MSWLKMGCWVLVSVAATAGVGACGGRGNLPTGEAWGGETGSGAQPFGGARPIGGAPANAGSPSVGGRASGGSTMGVAGVANGGAPNACVAGSSRCENNLLGICTGPGTGYILRDCGPMQRCVQSGAMASCQPLQCAPGQMLCDATGRFAQVCAADGLSVVNKVDCLAQRQYCQDGRCQSPMCVPGTADCDGSAMNGCETKISTDPKNCTACGLACSTNHVPAPTCDAGCTGKCAAGFQDCNGSKDKDGCESDSLNDDRNCGGCGNTCSNGQKCSGGKCGSFSSFTGVAQNVMPQSLTGWSLCYSEAYGQSALTSLDSIRMACTGSLLMMACRPVGKEALQLAAYAPRADVLFDTGHGDDPHVANGVGWYFSSSQSWGFAPAGDIITRDSCDTQDSGVESTGVDGELRLCWHTGDNYVKGGWRCGRDENLNTSTGFERLLFQAE